MRKKDLVSSLLALWLVVLPVCMNFSFASEIDDKRAELSGTAENAGNGNAQSCCQRGS